MKAKNCWVHNNWPEWNISNIWYELAHRVEKENDRGWRYLRSEGWVNTVVRVSSRVGSKRTPWLIDTRLDPGLCSSADSLPRGGSTVGGYRKTLVGRPIRPRLYLDAGRTRGLTTHKNNAYASSMNLGQLRPLSFLKVRKKMAKRMCQHPSRSVFVLSLKNPDQIVRFIVFSFYNY